MFTFVTSRYLRITSSKLHSEDSWVVLPLLASGEMEDEEARGGGEAKYGGDRGTVWMLGQIRTVSRKCNSGPIDTLQRQWLE